MAAKGPTATPKGATSPAESAPSAVDVRALIAVQQKNLDALRRANEALVDGMQMLLKRHVEIVQSGVETTAKTLERMLQEPDPAAQALQRLEAAQAMVEATLANVEELTALARKSQQIAGTILGERTLASLDEVRAALDRKPSA